MSDIAAALTASLPRDGSAPMTGDLQLSGATPVNGRSAVSKDFVTSFLAAATGMPTGAISAYAGNVAPAGYLECNGQAVNRTTYADLFGVISTIYGAGNGVDTFNVPDLRDYFIRGKSAARAVGSTQIGSLAAHTHPTSDPGHNHVQAAHTHSASQPAHTHGVSDPGHTHSSNAENVTGGYQWGAGGETHSMPATINTALTGISIAAGGADAVTVASETATNAPTVTGLVVGAAGGAETVPQNMAQIYIIKAIDDLGPITGIVGITSSDVNIIDIGVSNPVAPELVIHSNVAFGIPKLDLNGRISPAQLPAGTQSFLGTFDASTGQNPSQTYPAVTYLDGDTYLVSAQGTIPVYDPNTNLPVSQLVEIGWNLVYLNNTSQPVGWYFLEAPVVTAAIASQVAFSPFGTISATNVQDALEEVDAEKAPLSAATATGTSFTPVGTLSATDVQAAIAELDGEKAANLRPVYSGTLASSGVVGGATPLPLTDEFIRGFTKVGAKLYPLEPGYYSITGTMAVEATSSWLGGLLRKNGTVNLTQQVQPPYTSSFAVISIASMAYFDGVNDYVELCVNHSAGSGTVRDARMTIAKVSG